VETFWTAADYLGDADVRPKIATSVDFDMRFKDSDRTEPKNVSPFPALVRLLAKNANDAERAGSVWPSLQACASAGVFHWFLPREFGGWHWSDADILRGYVALSEACLATTFVITQRVAATKRLVACSNESLKHRQLPPLLGDESMVSVGISHLTTSGQHLGKPMLSATATSTGFVLNGCAPWVTGAAWCQSLVVGATLADGRQVLVSVDTKEDGVKIVTGLDMVALAASQTGAVYFENTRVPEENVLAGPQENVLQAVSVGTTGGLQTSALALGLASAAVSYVEQEAEKRPALCDQAQELRSQWTVLYRRLLGQDTPVPCDANAMRADANRLVLRATQAALLVAKGAGFVTGHPVGRWCREALFFLVWSCPQVVQDHHLCELTLGGWPNDGIGSAR
jgi:alkylation response protein AidB-like acyl-CoA dehydrogenase